MIQLGFLKQKGWTGMMAELWSVLTACFRVTVQPPIIQKGAEDHLKGWGGEIEASRGLFVSTFPPLIFFIKYYKTVLIKFSQVDLATIGWTASDVRRVAWPPPNNIRMMDVWPQLMPWPSNFPAFSYLFSRAQWWTLWQAQPPGFPSSLLPEREAKRVQGWAPFIKGMLP